MFKLGLEGKVAIITGGSDGLGRASAALLAAEGANVVICGRRAAHVEQAAADLSAGARGKVLGIQADVTQLADCERLVSGTIDAFGGLDILVNNAGASAASRLQDLDDAAWQADFDLKIMGAVRMCRLAIPHLKARGGGSIINASISGGKAPRAGQLPTSLSRAAGLNLTKSLSDELAADNIRVNAVCIGLLKSAQWDRRATDDAPVETLYANMASRVPLGRVGEAEEYADLIAFLASDRSTYITGTAVNIDGGLCATL
ncbi:MAG: SDR family oxidoreductase [Minwuia sp.]|nr:SDR family oxidoreductase [Minwuia sp.]